MSARNPIKIVVCGPTKGGKTSIANFIAGHTEQLGNANKIYEPTVGTRILECEKQPGITESKVPIEIWDLSGDQSYEACWPAVVNGAHGVILVYNPEIPSHETEIGICAARAGAITPTSFQELMKDLEEKLKPEVEEEYVLAAGDVT